MARTTKTTRSSAKQAPEPAPKKRLGRPTGSKNRAPSPGKVKAAADTVTKRALPKKAEAPVAPKFNKAELEAQIVKLERTIARLRKLNAELKQTRKDAAAAQPVTVSAAELARKPKQASAARTRRATKTTSAPETAALDTDEASIPEG